MQRLLANKCFKMPRLYSWALFLLVQSSCWSITSGCVTNALWPSLLLLQIQTKEASYLCITVSLFSMTCYVFLSLLHQGFINSS